MPRWIVACNLCFTPVNRKWYYFQFKCVLQLGSEYLHHQIPSTQISLSFCRCQWHWRRGQGRRSVQSSICCGISLLGVVPLTVVAFGGLSYSDTSMIQGRATSTLVHLFCESAVYGLFFCASLPGELRFFSLLVLLSLHTVTLSPLWHSCVVELWVVWCVTVIYLRSQASIASSYTVTDRKATYQRYTSK